MTRGQLLSLMSDMIDLCEELSEQVSDQLSGMRDNIIRAWKMLVEKEKSRS